MIPNGYSEKQSFHDQVASLSQKQRRLKAWGAGFGILSLHGKGDDGIPPPGKESRLKVCESFKGEFMRGITACHFLSLTRHSHD